MIPGPVPYTPAPSKLGRLCVAVLLSATLGLLLPIIVRGQTVPKPDTSKGTQAATTIVARDTALRISVRNIDITKFPIVSIIFDVFDSRNSFIGGLEKRDILISENGAGQDVLS